MAALESASLVFDWSTVGPDRFVARGQVGVQDETLRDGLQSPSVLDPPVETKIRLLHLWVRRLLDESGAAVAATGVES
jgi:2-isopropylmalate synthase